LALWFFLLTACAGVGVTVTHLQFQTSRADLMDPASPSAKTWKNYSSTFGGDSDLMVVVETATPNPGLLRSVIDDLGARLNREPQHFRNVLSSVNLSVLRRKALQFLTERELERTASRVSEYDRVVRQQRWEWLRADTLADTLRKQVSRARQQGGSVPESTWKAVERFALSLSGYTRHAMEAGQPQTTAFQSPLPELMDVAADQKLSDDATAYILNDAGTVGVIQVVSVVDPKAFNANAPAISRLRELAAEVQSLHGADGADLKISLTGVPALEYDEMTGVSVDMRNAALLAILIVGAVLLVTFRGVRHPLLALLTLMVALSWTFGAATLAVGHLNIISVCFAVFLIGLGIDFSVSFINRYLALRQELYELPEALREAAETTGSSVLTSAVTTALAFATAMLTGVPGLAELGLISGMGVLLCAISTFIFLPALIALSDAEVDIEQLPQPLAPSGFRKALVAMPSVSIGIAALVLVAVGWQAFRYQAGAVKCLMGYDPNLIALQDPTAEAVRAERLLTTSGTDSVFYAVSVAHSYEEAASLRKRFLALPSVGRVSDAASQLPERPDGRTMSLIRDLQQRASSVSPQLPPQVTADHMRVGQNVQSLYKLTRQSQHPTAVRATAALDQFLDDLSSLKAEPARQILTAYNDMTARWLLKEYSDIARADNFDAVGLKDVPPELKSRLVRVDSDNRQHWAIRVYPKSDAWGGAALTSFVSDLRTVDPEVTGIPIQHLESAGRIPHSYSTTGVYAVAVISLILLLNYLRPGQKLLTVLPPVAVAAFIGYTLQQRNGSFNPNLLVGICLGLVAFIAAVLDYRNLRDTVLTFLPAAGGAVLLLGTLALLGLQLNPYSLIALPLVFAIGIDNGIYLVSDARKQIAAGSREFELSADTMSSLLVTSLTSAIGFGSLMIAGHQGLFSMGLLLAVGVGSSLLISLTLMPPVLMLIARHQPASMDPVRITRKAGEAGDESASRDAAKNSSQSSKGQQRKAA
jgi:hypothetical protein